MNEQDGGRGEYSEPDELTRRLMEIASGQETASQSTGILDETTGECEALYGRSEFDFATGLREIRVRSLEDYQSLENELEALVGRYVRAIVRQDLSFTRRHLSDVLLVRTPEDGRRLRRWLDSCGSTYRGGLFIVADEGDHIHVVHDCPWSNNSCRCKWHQEAVSRILN